MTETRGILRSYQINELSEKARKRAYSKWEGEYLSEREFKDTLNSFCEIFDVKCTNWEFDSCSYNYSFSILNTDSGLECLRGIRLAKYIWNNYAEYITKGKYYSMWSKTEKEAKNPMYGKLKSRRSKVIKTMTDCPLTGVFYDNEVLSPIIDCLTYKRLFESYEELVKECLENLFKIAKKDCEYQESYEFFVEEAEANELEYFENGDAFYIPSGFEESHNRDKIEAVVNLVKTHIDEMLKAIEEDYKMQTSESSVNVSVAMEEHRDMIEAISLLNANDNAKDIASSTTSDELYEILRK